MGKPFTYSAVVTSCQRHALLRRTLESLAEFADALPERTIVVEDSHLDAPDWYWQLPLPRLCWLSNGRRRGQGYTVDRAWSEAGTGYFLHVEDDRPFIRSGSFLRQSFEILETNRDISAVMLHGLTAWMVKDPAYACTLYKPSSKGLDPSYDGISFANGLRRGEDYRLVGGDFARFEAGLDVEKLEYSVVEPRAGREYHRRGFVMATLEEAYSMHVDGHSLYGYEKKGQAVGT